MEAEGLPEKYRISGSPEGPAKARTTDLQHAGMKQVHSGIHPGAWCCHTGVSKDKEVEDTMLAKD